MFGASVKSLVLTVLNQFYVILQIVRDNQGINCADSVSLLVDLSQSRPLVKM